MYRWKKTRPRGEIKKNEPNLKDSLRKSKGFIKRERERERERERVIGLNHSLLVINYVLFTNELFHATVKLLQLSEKLFSLLSLHGMSCALTDIPLLLNTATRF